MPAVEKKALVRVDRKVTQAERLLDTISKRVVLVNFDVNFVEVRVAQAVPEVRAFERERLDDLTFAARVELRRRLGLLHGRAFRVRDERADSQLGGATLVVGKLDGHVEFCALRRDVNLF